MRYLRQGTDTKVTVGPFIDLLGIVPEVALTATNEKLTMTVDVAGVPTLLLDTNATASGGVNDLVHITNDDAGYYSLELVGATELADVGRASLCITYATDHLPVFHEFEIVPANVYDALRGTDKLTVDTVELNSVAASAAKLEKSASAITYGTTKASAGTTTTFLTASITEATTDHFKGRIILFLDGALALQATAITNYSLSGGEGLFTFNTLTEAVPNSTAFVIV
jgi:hypothetical protein